MFNVASSFKKFWNTNYFQNEPKFNGVYSRSNLPKIKVGAYVITLHEYKSIGTLWIALYGMVITEEHFTMRYILIALVVLNKICQKKLKKQKFIGNKNIITNIYRIQPYVSIMCGYFCIAFIDFTLRSSKFAWLYKFIFS